MKIFLKFALIGVLLLPLIGCRKKESPAPPASTTPTSVMLDYGKGAVLVAFGKTADFVRDDWMAQVFLEGVADTKSLPRIPLSDIQSALVLNVEPGKYKVIAHAWMRGLSPTSGGNSIDSVEVRSGEVTILKSAPIGLERYPYPTTYLTLQGREIWTLESPQKLHEFLAAAEQKPVKR